MRPSLPVDDVLDELEAALRAAPRALVVAPPGSGKTTRVSPALLDRGLAGDGRVLLLQPRRVAARLAARRIASERGGRVGGEVGYQVRFDRRISAETRLEVLTEGLLLRRLQADPLLEGVGAVVLDEVHERSLHVDLALALLREVQEVREDLVLVIMSATVDPGPFVAFLGGPAACAVVEASGRTWPVALRHLPRPDTRRIPERVASGVRQVLRDTAEGHVLAFLPGAGEIAATEELLRDGLRDGGVEVLPLHGRLPGAAQDRALAPASGRKVVLATNIAETSVTLPGVRAVVDSGLARVPHFLPAWGLTRLSLQPVALDSADQRAGRAGRTGPGLCLRLWTAAEEASRAERTEPEVHRVDLAGTVLELLAWGAVPEDFGWLEAPASGRLAAARAHLADLGALDARGQLTEVGRQLVGLPTSPRLGRALLAARAAGCLGEVASLAALSEARDPWEGDGALGLDAAARVSLLDQRGGRVHRGRLARVREVREQLLRLGRRLDPVPEDAALGDVEDVLLRAWPDRVARRRHAGSEALLLSGGVGARVEDPGLGEVFVALDLDGGRAGERAEARVRLAWPLTLEALTERATVSEAEEVSFDPQREAVIRRRVRRLAALELEVHPPEGPGDPSEIAACLEAAARAAPERALRPDEEAQGLMARLRFLQHHLPEEPWPELPGWEALLPELCWGQRSFAELHRADLARALRGRLGHDLGRLLDAEAPERWPLPGGSRGRLSYGGPEEPPVLAARIQQLMGLTETPRVARGRVPVVVHLLAPNGRPAQVTQDLAGFWAGSYAEVRKELRGRYPKHPWPEDGTVPLPPRRRRSRS